jgi:ubiquinone/menaquinone biosynthesis C-methylase UbiE
MTQIRMTEHERLIEDVVRAYSSSMIRIIIEKELRLRELLRILENAGDTIEKFVAQPEDGSVELQTCLVECRRILKKYEETGCHS